MDQGTERERERGVEGRACLLWVQLPLTGCAPHAVESPARDKHVCTHGKVHVFYISIVLNQC